MYDLRDWFLMPSTKAGFKTGINQQIYGRETHHLEGVNMQGKKVYAYHFDNGKSMWFTKTPQGFPWDGKPYNLIDITDSITELNWTSPSDYKMNLVPLKIAPRFWDGDESWFTFTPSPMSQQFTNCKKTGGGPFGPVFCRLKGPFYMDHGGDIQTVKTILLEYFWADGQHREQLFLTLEVGWEKWTHAVKTVFSPGFTDYTIDATSVHNKIVPGSLTPKFSCMNPLP